MKTLIPTVALVLLAGASSAQVVVKDGEKAYVVEVVSTNIPTSTLIVRDENGQSTLRVEDGAMRVLRAAKPGDRIRISTLDSNGERRVVSAVVSGTLTDMSAEPEPARTVRVTERKARPGFVELDPAIRKVTVIDANGDRQVIRAEDRAALPAARPGQKMLVSYRYDRDGTPEAEVRVVPIDRRN
jgi:hypothetical protein